jgi:hypothetical protein
VELGVVTAHDTSRRAPFMTVDRDRRLCQGRRVSSTPTLRALTKAYDSVPMPNSKQGAGESSGPGPKLLSGGNPQIPKGEGDEPVQAYIAAMPGWKRSLGKQPGEKM